MVINYESGAIGASGRPFALIGSGTAEKEQWFNVFYQGYKIGYAQASLVPSESQGVPGYSVRERAVLAFNLIGMPQRLDLLGDLFVDADWRLQFFNATVVAGGQQMSWRGDRQGDGVQLTFSTAHNTTHSSLTREQAAAFTNGFSSWAAFRKLDEKQSGQVWVINPIALRPEPMDYRVLGKEPMDGTEAFIVETEMAGVRATSWVTADGEVLKEISPFGWEVRRSTEQEAKQLPGGMIPALDMLLAMGVQLEKPIEHPDLLDALTLDVQGIACSDLTIRSPWQSNTPLAGEGTAGGCRVRLSLPRQPSPTESAPPEIAEYLKASPSVQSDDPRIASLAQKITQGKTDPWEKAMAIYLWVFQNLKKEFSLTFPSAIDVLEQGKGDCHEHTVLFTALARAAGLPTRMVAGMVYQEHRFFYHAWPEVWIGEWIPVDPTLGQPVADATHIRFFEAENEELTSMARFVGKIKIKIVEEQSVNDQS